LQHPKIPADSEPAELEVIGKRHKKDAFPTYPGKPSILGEGLNEE